MKNELQKIIEYVEAKNSYLFKDNIQLEYEYRENLIELYKKELDSNGREPFARFSAHENIWNLFYFKDNSWVPHPRASCFENLVKCLIIIEEDKEKLFW